MLLLKYQYNQIIRRTKHHIFEGRPPPPRENIASRHVVDGFDFSTSESVVRLKNKQPCVIIQSIHHCHCHFVVQQSSIMRTSFPSSRWWWLLGIVLMLALGSHPGHGQGLRGQGQGQGTDPAIANTVEQIPGKKLTKRERSLQSINTEQPSSSPSVYGQYPSSPLALSYTKFLRFIHIIPLLPTV